MPGTYLEPTINLNSPESYNYESVPRTINQVPENQFEAALNNAYGTSQALSFLASDGVAFANSQSPSFGGTIVSTGISNLSGTQFSGAGSTGFGGGGFSASGYGYSAGLNTSGGAGAIPSLLSGSNGGFPGGVSNAAYNGAGAGTTDGFTPGGVKGGLLDEGLQQILLMVEVQQAARTLDAMSNILKTAHDSQMNTLRNIRS